MALYWSTIAGNSAHTSRVDLPTQVGAQAWAFTLPNNEVPIGPAVVSGTGLIWFLARLFPYDLGTTLTTVYLYVMNTDGTVLRKRPVPDQIAILQSRVSVTGFLTVDDSDRCFFSLKNSMLGWDTGTFTFSGTNLVVDAVDNTKVTPDGHTPGPGDIGGSVAVTGGFGWTPGSYLITDASGGQWTLESSPAAIGTTGGLWSFYPPDPIWRFDLSPADPSGRHITDATLTPSGDVLFLTTADTGIRSVVILAAADGSAVSSFSTTYKHTPSDLLFPTLDASGIYLPLDSGPVSNALMVKFDYSGGVLWTYTIGNVNTDDADAVSPSVDGTFLYFVGNNTAAAPDFGSTNQVFSLDASTGTQKWIRHDAADNLYSQFLPLAIDGDGDVFSGVLSSRNIDELLTLVNRTDGSTLWSFVPSPPIGSSLLSDPTSPLIGNDGFALWADKDIYRVDLATGIGTLVASAPAGFYARRQVAVVPSWLYATMVPESVFLNDPFPNPNPGAIVAYEVSSPPPTAVDIIGGSAPTVNLNIEILLNSPAITGLCEALFYLAVTGLADGQVYTTGDFGTPTAIVIPTPVSGSVAIIDVPVVDLDGFAKGLTGGAKIWRVGDDNCYDGEVLILAVELYGDS